MSSADRDESLNVLSTWRQWLGVMVVALVTTIGTLWYWLVENFSLLDAAYQSVITVSTVGFGEVGELDTSGRLFTIGLIVVGVAAMVYALGSLAGTLIESSINRINSRRKERSLERLQDHVLICGYGRFGVEVARLLPAGGHVGVIDADPDRTAMATRHGHVAISGDATLDATLLEAGIERAVRLIVCLSHDGDAISTILSARALSPSLHIVSRVNIIGSGPKLRMAGANHVVSPIAMAAQRLVGDTIDPSIGSFLDAALHDQKIALSIRAAACGRPLDPEEILEMESRSGARVLGVQKPTGAAPIGGSVDEGDLLVAAGHHDELLTFIALVAARA